MDLELLTLTKNNILLEPVQESAQAGLVVTNKDSNIAYINSYGKECTPIIMAGKKVIFDTDSVKESIKIGDKTYVIVEEDSILAVG